MRKLLLAPVLGLSVVGCGSNPTAAPTPTPTPSTTPPTMVTPTTPAPTPTPTTLTRAQAARRYLQIVKPTNDTLDDPKCKQSEDFFINGGSWPPNEHPNWDEHAYRVLRDCYKRLATHAAQEIKDFQSTPWPVDAKDDMADLILLDQALLRCYRQGSRATSDDDIYEVMQDCFPKDDDSADRVRARFGLPGRSS